MKPITVAVVGDDPHAVRILAKLQECDPTKIIVVGHAPQIYERPFHSDPLEFIYPNVVEPLVIRPYYAEPDVLCVSNKMIGLLRRAGVTIKSGTNDDSPQRG